MSVSLEKEQDALDCSACGAVVEPVEDRYVDSQGYSTCEIFHDWCPACQGGEEHPHEVAR